MLFRLNKPFLKLHFSAYQNLMKASRQILPFPKCWFSTEETKGANGSPKRKMTEGYHRTYKHDPRVSMILKSTGHDLNMLDKHRYNTLIKFCAESLYRNYGKKNEHAVKAWDDFMELISKSISNNTDSAVSHLDTPSFLQFLKHLADLRKEILENKGHEISPQSFLVFLDKISSLTNSDKLNEYIMRKLSEINIDMLDVEKMLNAYQQHSVDDKFEENLRIDEIKKFASGVKLYI